MVAATDAIEEWNPVASDEPSGVLDVDGIWKRFGDRDVVRDVSFGIERGRVLGLVGPNGAGKTTSIRIALGIFPPDRGRVRVLGRPLTQETRGRIGYLPEERGLYDQRRILDTLIYLGQLKGLARSDAGRRATEMLERFGLGPHRTKKVGELSHGMAQLVQLTATIMHEPELVVLDEPFTALDPVNMRRLKDIVLDLRRTGTALVLSTHQMNQVEELCDRVVMIDHGTVALSGELDEIRRRFPSDELLVTCDPLPDRIEGVSDVRATRDGHVMRMHDGTTPENVIRQILDAGSHIERFAVAVPSMEEIFVSVAGGER